MRILKTQEMIHLFFSLLIFSLTCIYLAAVNFSIPFVVMDEIRTVAQKPAEVYEFILMYGRPSTVISHVVNQLISFERVSFLELIPRFLAMLTLLIGLVLIFKLLNFSTPASLISASITIVLHQIDWQHNGLIAFFSGYALILGVYFVAIFIVIRGYKGFLPWLSSFLFILIAYSSEIFIALSLVLLVASSVIYGRRPNLKNPFFLSLIIYVIFFIYIKNKEISLHAGHMSNYIFGAYQEFSFYEIYLSICVYLAGTIPFFKVNVKNTPYVAALIVLGSFFILKVIFKSLYFRWKKIGFKALDKDHLSTGVLIALVSATLLLLPPLVMSMQPLKVHWAINGMSNRYAFSLYGWTGLILLFATILSLHNGRIKLFQKIKIIQFGIIGLAMYSAYVNLSFVKTYSSSFAKWQALNSQALDGNGDLLVDRDLLKHPYIVVYEPKLYKEYFRTVYSRRLLVCDLPGTNLSKSENYVANSVDGEMVKISNFYLPEDDGRWTKGLAAQIQFMGDYPSGTLIFLEISAVFGSNNDNPIVFKIGDLVVERKVSPGSIIKLRLHKEFLNPILEIHPFADNSPASLGLSSDDRRIGLKIKRLNIVGSSDNEETIFQTKVCNE